MGEAMNVWTEGRALYQSWRRKRDADLIARAEAQLDELNRYRLKQQLAKPGRYYGNGGTIHTDGHISVETRGATVVGVWFRCQQLPFTQRKVDEGRAASLRHQDEGMPTLVGVELVDQLVPGVKIDDAL